MEKTIYHSTKKISFDEIIKSQKVKTHKNDFPKDKQPGSLGFGFYGFSSKYLCKQYGLEKLKSDFKFLNCKIIVDERCVLDLRDDTTLKKYLMYKKFIKTNPIYKETIAKYRNAKQSSREGAFIEQYLTKFTNIKCVIAMTSTQIETSDYSYVANGTEYCIRDNDVIKIKEGVELWDQI